MREESDSNGKTIAGVRGETTETNDALSDSSGRTRPEEDDVSPGVARIAAINRNMTRADRIGVFIGVFLIAYAYGLDGTIRSTYQVRWQHSFAYVHSETDMNSLRQRRWLTSTIIRSSPPSTSFAL